MVMLTATLLGISPLHWFLFFSGVTTIAVLYIVVCICQAIWATPPQLERELVVVEADPPRSIAAELNELLSSAGLEFDFKVWKRPIASTKGTAEVATPGALSHTEEAA